MGPAKREMEIKLTGAPRDVAALRDVKAVRKRVLGEGARTRLTSTYFDTADGAMREAGATLRLRESPKGRTQTIKCDLGAGVLARIEDEQRLNGGDAFPLPPTDEKAAALLDGSLEVEPVSRIVVDRWSAPLRIEGALIELAIDVGRAEALRDDAIIAVGPLAEAELELVEGDPAALFELAAELIAKSDGRLRLGVLSKAEQAMRLADAVAIPADPAMKLEPDAEAGDVLAEAMMAAAQRLALLAPAVTDHRLSEGVHQSRVALRRLRSVARIYRRAVKSKALKKLSRRARKFAKALGPARDWDVFVDETLAPALDAPMERKSVPKLKARAESLRAAAWEDAARIIGSADYSLFILDLMKAAYLQKWRKRAGPVLIEPAIEFAARALESQYAAAETEARRAVGADSLETRHRLRIALKKLRYTAQTFRSLFPRDLRKPFMAAMSKLQDDLGAINDAAVAQSLANAAAMGQGKALARAAGFVSGFHAIAALEAADRVDEDWRAFAAMTPFWRDKESPQHAEDSRYSVP